MGSKQLRVTKPQDGDLGEVVRNPVYVVLDNVMDTYNVGAVFRLADATAIKELILCGKTDYPPSTRIHKAAVGTEEWVPWRYESNTLEALKKLKLGIPELKIIAVEQDERAVSLKQLEIQKGINTNPVAIIVGHETDGCLLYTSHNWRKL